MLFDKSSCLRLNNENQKKKVYIIKKIFMLLACCSCLLATNSMVSANVTDSMSSVGKGVPVSEEQLSHIDEQTDSAVKYLVFDGDRIYFDLSLMKSQRKL